MRGMSGMGDLRMGGMGGSGMGAGSGLCTNRMDGSRMGGMSGTGVDMVGMCDMHDSGMGDEVMHGRHGATWMDSGSGGSAIGMSSHGIGMGSMDHNGRCVPTAAPAWTASIACAAGASWYQCSDCHRVLGMRFDLFVSIGDATLERQYECGQAEVDYEERHLDSLLGLMKATRSTAATSRSRRWNTHKLCRGMRGH